MVGVGWGKLVAGRDQENANEKLNEPVWRPKQIGSLDVDVDVVHYVMRRASGFSHDQKQLWLVSLATN